MAEILLVGGSSDGRTVELPPDFTMQERDRVLVVADPPSLRAADFDWQVPTTPQPFRKHAYRVCTIHITDQVGNENRRAVLRFGHSTDITPSEALVMLMQHNQGSGERT